ncbi:MAG: histidine phosphatase family protein [Pseudomonadota bacterium]
MRKVILMRHAKSSWDDPRLDDHDRPLNGRGKRAAPAMARWLTSRGHLPGQILWSSSTRTRATVKLMRRTVPDLPSPRIACALYHAAPDTMLGYLRDAPEDVDTVMLVGHQPGLGALTRMLTGGQPPRRCARAFEEFPTAAAAVLEIDVPGWAVLDYCTARFVDFAKPRELLDA